MTQAEALLALYEAYRGVVIGRTARIGPAAEGMNPPARIGALSCDCTCHRQEWLDGEPERHVGGCMASPIWLKQVER